ncbi:ferritin-like domain-containing protein [Rhizosaccharibacter radicis]|uniref:Ferritin-like domain-containing protein n=1 Tax=Rhizosaccharibacter radicis TaxID=2782605 RepID=A0ABT1VZT9_9PROT|nr:ferritin-like domain-containing protein [Acetobacteraceae bacterium KSS12]
MTDPIAISPRGVDADTIREADRVARHWTSPHQGRLRPGSAEHKQAVCRMFHDTFNPYKPSVIDWPKLDAETLARIVSLPIWDIAVQTEGKARLRMAAYAATIADPDMRETIARNGWEENRHKEVLSRLVEAYGIPLAPEPEYREPRDPEWAYLVTGFSECIDSFFAFGLFAMAHRSGIFPPELIDTFEPVMQEECRHILLFANWLAWHRRTMPLWRRPWFELRVLAVWAFLGWERVGLAKSIDADGKEQAQDNNFTVNGTRSVSAEEISVPELMALCLRENDRRFAGYDRRLLRPTTMPALVRVALLFMRRPKRSARREALA